MVFILLQILVCPVYNFKVQLGGKGVVPDNLMIHDVFRLKHLCIFNGSDGGDSYRSNQSTGRKCLTFIDRISAISSKVDCLSIFLIRL